MILKQEIHEVKKEIIKRPYPGQFYGSQISCSLLKVLTHMVTVYIVIPDIIIKLIRANIYFRSPFFTKLMNTQIIKDLLYNLIIFYKGDYSHLFPASGT